MSVALDPTPDVFRDLGAALALVGPAAILMGMAQRSREQMYATTGLTDAERDRVIYALRRRRRSYARIAKTVGVSVGAVRASLDRTAAKLGQRTGSTDWDADLR